jgi:rhodanese-related sulfurtransferase
MLMDKGFTRVRPLEGGLDAWADAGFEIETVIADRS